MNYIFRVKANTNNFLGKTQPQTQTQTQTQPQTQPQPHMQLQLLKKGKPTHQQKVIWRAASRALGRISVATNTNIGVINELVVAASASATDASASATDASASATDASNSKMSLATMIDQVNALVIESDSEISNAKLSEAIGKIKTIIGINNVTENAVPVNILAMSESIDKLFMMFFERSSSEISVLGDNNLPYESSNGTTRIQFRPPYHSDYNP
jgi:hypothetical protein